MRYLRTRSKELRRAERLESQAKAILDDAKYTDSASARLDLARQADALYRQAMDLRRGPTEPTDEIFF